MSPADGHERRRRDDATWIRVMREFGLPTVMAIGLFWAWDGSVREERRLAVLREERLTAVVSKLTSSIDALTAGTIGEGERLGNLATRVERLEQLGARAMARHLDNPQRRNTP